MNIKQFIPASIRLYFKLLYREVKDKRSSVIFAQKKPTTPNFSFSISDRQTIRQANYYQNKVDNIKLGGEIYSGDCYRTRTNYFFLESNR